MIRIIGGKHRSRIIKTPESDDILPTKNVVREALFSILGRDISMAVVLDLFAGSGALGFECLSRGAQKVYFSDRSPQAIKTIKENAKILCEEGNVEIRQCDFSEMLNYLEENRIEVNLVLLDPPYESGVYDELINRLLSSSILKPRAQLAVESRHEIDLPIMNDYECRRYRYGQTHLLIIRK